MPPAKKKTTAKKKPKAPATEFLRIKAEVEEARKPRK